MGQRQESLNSLLMNAGYRIRQDGLPRPHNLDHMVEADRANIASVYARLGGTANVPPTNVGKWDLCVGEVAIELDEEQHFNRYRLATLDSSLYNKIAVFPLREYRDQCRTYEAKCLKKAGRGGYWTNPNCVRQFGVAGNVGEFDRGGAPRWKQRAFYDYIKDLAPLIISVPVARISIWDTIDVDKTEMPINAVLQGRMKAPSSLVALIERRAGVKLK